MHNAAFEALGLDYVYVAHDVPTEQLAPAMAGIRALGYRGLSITIPHKVAAMSLVVGMLSVMIAGQLGALGALRRAEADPKGKHVVVLGSGGAARAIAMTIALESPPKKLTILGGKDTV